MTSGQMQGPPIVPVGPVPSTWAYGIAETPDGAALVYIMSSHPAGRQELFLSLDEAEQVGRQLLETVRGGREKQSQKIVIPSKVLLGPGGDVLSFRSGPSSRLDGSPSSSETDPVVEHPSVHPEVLEAAPEEIVGASEHIEGCVRGDNHPGECVVHFNDPGENANWGSAPSEPEIKDDADNPDIPW